MEKNKIYFRKLLSLTMSFLMLLSAIPAVLPASTLPPDGRGTVTAVTGGDCSIDGNAEASTVITYNSATLQWFPADPTIGRAKDGWWVGIKVASPEEMKAKEAFKNPDDTDKVTFKAYSETRGWSEVNSFWDFQDSDPDVDETERYIVFWNCVDEERINAAVAENGNIKYGFEFNWDGAAQTVILEIVPGGLTLKKEEAVVYPSSKTYGLVETLTDGLEIDGENADSGVVKVTNPGETVLSWFPKDEAIGRYRDGWWAGVRITAPAETVVSETEDVKFKSQRTGDWSDEQSFYECQDQQPDTDVHCMSVWVPVDENALSTGEGLKSRLKFDWDRDGVYEQLVVIELNPDNIQLMKDSAKVYPLADVTTFTGGAVEGNKTEEVRVTVTELSLDMVPADPDIGRDENGWWVGIKVTAPEALSAEQAQNAKFKVGEGEEKSFWEYADSKVEPYYIEMWKRLTPEKLSEAGESGENIVTEYLFDWDGDGVFGQKVILTVVPGDSIVLNKAEQAPFDCKFKVGDEETVEMTHNQTGQFEASGGSGTGEVVYSITSGEDVAQIDADGKVTTLKAGEFTVEVRKEGDGYYKQSNPVELTITVKKAEQVITFGSNPVTCCYGTQSYKQEAELSGSGCEGRKVKYSITENNIGAEINPDTGEITFGDSEEKAGIVTVTAAIEGCDSYDDAEATYQLEVEYLDAADLSCTFSEPNANGWYNDAVTIYPPAEHKISYTDKLSEGWEESVAYETEGKTKPLVYLRRTADGAITAAIELGELKIDKTAPVGLEITYSGELSFWQRVLSTVTFGYYSYNPSVEVTLRAEDITSGIDKFEWTYTKETGASDVNVETVTKAVESGDLTYSEDGKTASYVFTLPLEEAEQLRGCVSFVATDRAGNATGYNQDNKDEHRVNIVDSKAPEISVEYVSAAESHYTDGTDGHEDSASFAEAANVYFKEKTSAVITIDEANFFEGETDENTSEVIHKVGILVEKTDPDGNVTRTEYLPEGAAQMYEDAAKETFTWNTVGDKHSFTIDYTADGEYVLTVKYTDFSNNEANISSKIGDAAGQSNVSGTYTSKRIIVDNTDPKIGIEYPDTPTMNKEVDGVKHYGDQRDIVIVVTERNFRAADIVLSEFAANDVTGSEIADKDKIRQDFQDILTDSSKWDRSGNVYRATLSFEADAQYSFAVDYKGLSGREAERCQSETFAVDKTAPVGLEITYSGELSFWQRVLSTVTFGYYSYNPSVEVTLRAEDITSGIDKFEWTYTKEAGASDVNVETVTRTVESGDLTYSEDGKTASYVFTLPLEEEEPAGAEPAKKKQLRGCVSFVATDRAGNATGYNEDNEDEHRVNIVDSKAPEISVKYASAAEPHYTDGTDGHEDSASFAEAANVYFKEKTSAVITIDEANFFEGETDENTSVVIHKVGILVEKTDPDGNVTKTEYLPEGAAQMYEDAAEKTFTWNTVGDKHSFTIDYTADGEYVLTVEYTDFSNNEANISSKIGDAAGQSNVSGTYTSKRIIVDNTEPEISLSYKSENPPVQTIDGRDYFDCDRTATITIKEHNFRAADTEVTAVAKDAAENDVEKGDKTVGTFIPDYCRDSKNWRYLTADGEMTGNIAEAEDADIHVIVVELDTDANYDFCVKFADLACNNDETAEDHFAVDKVKPAILRAEYDPDVSGNAKVDDGTNTGDVDYYDDRVKITVRAADITAGVDYFVYSYLIGANVSRKNASLRDQEIHRGEIEFDGENASMVFYVPKEALGANNQFNGTIRVIACDRSGNESEEFNGTPFVVDNTRPVSEITVSDPVKEENDISYYDGNIDVTIAIDEANFFSNDVIVQVTRNGEAYGNYQVRWTDNSVDLHTGTFTLTEDGDYTVSVSYTDRSGNSMEQFRSNQLTIDTKLPVVRITGIKHESANNGEKIGFTLAITDRNIASEDIRPKLTAIVNNGARDFTSEELDIELGDPLESKNADDETVFEYIVQNLETDGFYSLVCTVTDHAKHEVKLIESDTAGGTATKTEKLNFSVNREGSVFWIETKPDKLDRTYFNGEVELVLHELNVDKVGEGADEDKKTVFMLNDGSKFKDVKLEEIGYVKNEMRGEGGWYECVYTLDNNAFDHDGVYSINLNTYDEAGNSNVNSKTESGTISFTIDRTDPVISTNIKNKQRVKDSKFYVQFKITDTNLDPDSIVVHVTDNRGKEEETAVESLGSNEYKFLVKSGFNRTVTIEAKDFAGNVSEPCRIEHFTVSENFFVLWYANTPLFWGSIGGTLLLVGIVVLIIIFRKRKKNDGEGGKDKEKDERESKKQSKKKGKK